MVSTNEHLSEEALKEIAREEAAKPKHGRISLPESRAQFLFEDGKLDAGQVNELEAGKFFPETEGDLEDPFAPDDVRNHAPPVDGTIASGGRTADARNLLNEPGSHWKKHSVKSGETLDLRWEYSQTHKTRRWKYLITKPGWDHREALSRHHFEAEPIKTYLNEYRPYWGSESGQLIPPIMHIHQVTLPPREGYHVLLALWEVADTENCFYQVIDLNFSQ